MAEAITNIKRMEISEKEIREENIEAVLDALSDNKEAILKGITLLQTLEDSGLLDMANALVKQRKAAMDNIFTELNKPMYTGILENVSQLLFLLGDLDVEKLGEFTERINQGLTETYISDPDEKVSTLSLLKALKDPEINRSITMLLQFLRGMGRD
ncbi:MAG TPA: DUF1641 domain-containing protein [Bacillota bacterium]|nr:DUF1641 domain-containing protein [Bacillota bacterium]